MGIWQAATKRAREAAHLTAAGLTLLFVAPVGGYLIYQQHSQSREFDLRAAHHAELCSQRVQQTLNQAGMAATLLAEGFHNFESTQLATVAESILKIFGAASSLEITPDGQAPIVVTRKAMPANELQKQALAIPTSWQHPVPLGTPRISLRGQQLLISQSLVNRSAEGRTRFWGDVSITLYFPALAEASQFSELLTEGLAVRVRHVSHGQPSETLLFDNIPEQNAILASSETRLAGDNQFLFDIAPIKQRPISAILAPWLYLLACSILLYTIHLRILRRPFLLEQEVRLRTALLDDEKRALRAEIENRQDAERMLERSHRLLDSIFEHIPGMIILKRANDRRIARTNRSGEEILGRSRQSLIGRSNDEIYDVNLAERLNQSDEEVIRTGEALDLAVEQITMPGQPGRWVKLRKTVLLGDQGIPEYILEFGQDVSEQEKLDLRLREHLHFLEQLIDAIPGPIYFKDTKGRYIGVNSAFERYIGVSRSEISGKTIFDISSPPLAYTHHQADMDLLNDGGNQYYESTVQDTKGQERDVIFHKAVFHRTDGDVGGIVGILLDITERKQAETQVARLNRLLSLLSDTNQTIVRVRDPARLLKVVADLLCRSGKFPIAWVHLAEDDQLLISTDCCQREVLIREILGSRKHKIAKTGQYLEIGQAVSTPLAQRLQHEGLCAYITLPLHSHGKHLGNIGILDANLQSFSNNDKQLIEDLANNISHALESMQAEAERRAASEQLELAARVSRTAPKGSSSPMRRIASCWSTRPLPRSPVIRPMKSSARIPTCSVRDARKPSSTRICGRRCSAMASGRAKSKIAERTAKSTPNG